MSKKKPLPEISTNLSPVQQALQNQKAPNIVHHRGDLNKVTVKGKVIHRPEYVFLDLHGTGFPFKIKCAPYDNHFVFKDPTVTIGWTTFCTCGAISVVTGWDAYKQDASPQGALLVCYSHAQTGKHNDVNYSSANMANG